MREERRRIGLDPSQREPKSRPGSPAVDRRDRSPSHLRLPERLPCGLSNVRCGKDGWNRHQFLLARPTKDLSFEHEVEGRLTRVRTMV